MTVRKPQRAFEGHVVHLATKLQTAYQGNAKANPEDQLKTPIKNFLESAGILTTSVVLKTEVQEKGVAGRPDMGLEVGGLLSGHIELKAPDVGIDPKKFDERSKKQFERFKALPNLIYSNGNEWALYRSGVMVSKVHLGNLTEDGESGLNNLQVSSLGSLLKDFMTWQPITPATPRDLAEFLAPICRMVRDDVRSALQNPDSAIEELAKDWRSTLFPETDDSEFADAYAQTLTYALLLARIRGASNLEPDQAAKALDAGHNLLAGALRILGSHAAREELGVGVDILIRCLSAFDPSDITGRLRRTWIHEGDPHYPTDDQAFTRKDEDPWLYFYEDFLAAYDKKLRNDYGVYYTPTPVILCQVRLVHSLLKTKLGKPLGLAEESVTVLDPAAGTGAFPLAVLDQALAEAEAVLGVGARTQVATQLAQNVHAFEFLVGPYAVAHLRLTQKIQEEGGALPKDGAHVYLTDTLEAPEERDLSSRGLLYKRLTDEHKRALKVKRESRVMVCLGNPPYDRQERSAAEKGKGVQLKGGWVRFGKENVNDETNGILKDYTDSAKLAGAGGHLRNIYNSYVFFWRWAMWKVFEQTTEQPGIICFITAASYLRGPGFIGMREHLRRTLDELWIIDLGGDNIGARKDENVFAIRTPVCIALGVRYEHSSKTSAAAVTHYCRIEGSRQEKLTQLANIQDFNDFEWEDVSNGWQAPLVPQVDSNYRTWPKLADLFPWQQTGAKLHRSWPIAPVKSVLEERWRKFLSGKTNQRSEWFSETRDRKIKEQYADLAGAEKMAGLSTLLADAPAPRLERYSYRSFDNQWVMADTRMGDYLRPSLWQSSSKKQIFLSSMLTKQLGFGPSITVSVNVPDIDYFSGRGAKDILPLYRDAAATQPNITVGLLLALETMYQRPVTPEDLLAYVYALLGAIAYAERFAPELATPGPHVPITCDGDIFFRVATAGRKLIGIQTYGERLGKAHTGKAKSKKAIPATPDGYPHSLKKDVTYHADKQELQVGEGIFGPVSPQVWEFSISGLQVVRSWLGYRMAERSGKKSSPLDDIRPESWPLEYTKELLALLWLLEGTIEMQPQLTALLDEVLSGELLQADQLPQPSAKEREAPKSERKGGVQGGLF